MGSLHGPNMRAVVIPSAGSASPVNFSGTGYVTGLQSDADEDVFHLEVKTGGLYKLSLGYRAIGRKGYEVEVNDVRLSGTMGPTPAGEFGSKQLGRLSWRLGRMRSRSTRAGVFMMSITFS